MVGLAERIALHTAFFNLVGGRRQDSSETFRVNGSLRTHGGEELGFYAVSEATPLGPMGARARRVALEVIQGELTSRFDLPYGARLRHAVASAHEALMNEFSGHVQVGLTVLLAVERSLYLLQVPPTQAYVLHDGALHSISPTQPGEARDFSSALGSAGEPFVCLFRDAIEPGDVVVLSGSWMAESMDPEDLRTAFGEEGSDRITHRLVEMARRLGASELTCVTLQAVSEAVTADSLDSAEREHLVGQPRSVWDYVDEAVGSLSYVLGRAREELTPPSRARATPHQTSALARARMPSGAGVQTAAAQADAYDDEGVLEDIPSAQGALDVDWPHENPTEELPVVPAPSGQSESDLPSYRNTARDVNEIDEINSRIRTSPNPGTAPPPIQAFPDTNVVPERIYAGSGGTTNRQRDRYGDLSTGSALKPRPRRAGRRTSPAIAIPPAMLLWSGVGLGIVVLMIILIIAFSGGGSTALADSRTEATKAVTAFKAHEAKLANRDLALAWSDIATGRRQHLSAADLSLAQAYVQKASDTLHLVYHPHAALIVHFTAQGSAPKYVAAGGSDLFVLDPQRRQVYWIDPAHPAFNVHHLAGQAGSTSFNVGGQQVTLTAPKLLASNDNNAVGDINQAVALDGHMDVLVNDPKTGTAPLTVETLTPPETGAQITATTVWSDNLYVLDTHAGQVYRYAASGSSYTPFDSSAESRIVKSDPALRSGTSIAVANASIYVALKNGSLLKFSLDKSNPDFDSQVPFKTQLPVQLGHATEVYARDGLNRIFLVNSAAGKIVELTDSGSYVRMLVVPNPLIHGMTGMTVSANGSTVYFLSGRGLYSMPVNAGP